METTTKSIKFKLLPLTKSKKRRLQQLADKFKEVYNNTSILLPSIKDRRQSKARTVLNQWRKDINIEITPINTDASTEYLNKSPRANE